MTTKSFATLSKVDSIISTCNPTQCPYPTQPDGSQSDSEPEHIADAGIGASRISTRKKSKWTQQGWKSAPFLFLQDFFMKENGKKLTLRRIKYNQIVTNSQKWYLKHIKSS